MLELVLELSFVMGQMWACIPRLQLLADATGLDKADASRTLARLIGKGALMLQKHRDERLYSIQLFCKEVPLRHARPPASDPQKSEAAVQALRVVQERRLGGSADGSGQMHLPGRIALERAEDLDLEKSAMGAMLETPAVQRPEELLSADLPDAVFAQELEQMVRRAVEEQPRSRGPGLAGRATVDRVASCERGLTEEQRFLWDALKAEFARGGERSMADFRQWAPKWKQRLLEDGFALREAVSEHRLKKEKADNPGGYILWQYDLYRQTNRRLPLQI